MLGIPTISKGERMKYVYLCLGFVGLALGAFGAVVPLLPSFPFLLLAFISFGKGSAKLDRWFRSTKLYKNNLESYVHKQGITRGNNIRVMSTVTLVMVFGFIMMHQIRLGQVVLAIVWLGHILYFSYGVKNRASDTTLQKECENETKGK
ncbi:MAG: YbaN family protein [Sphaerochaeta sp.]|nr:YbaN family protein [Sphaerochaeta sp.]